MLIEASELAELFNSPPEIVLNLVETFSAFKDFLNFRHASPALFRFTTAWETPIVTYFLKSGDVLVADRLFRTLLPKGPVTFDYLLRLRRRCTTAGNLAAFLINHVIPENAEYSCYDYTWLGTTVGEGSLPSSNGDMPVTNQLNADKLKRCLLLHNHFFESLHAGLAHHFVKGDQEKQPQPEDSAFLHVEAAILSQYTPSAIDRLLGIHEWLFAVVVSRCGYEPPQTLMNAEERSIFEALDIDPFLFGGYPALEDAFMFAPNYRLERLYARLHEATSTSKEAVRCCVPISRQVLPPLDLETAKKVSSSLPTGYVRNLGVGWANFVDRDSAFAEFKSYVLSTVDYDEEMFVQHTSANRSVVNANPKASLCVTSECSSDSTATIPIAHFNRRMRRSKRPCAFKGLGRR